tara:strand:+ start:223 stop:357 length:135 start_codon:yes stop_codon:yes gene_type:complete
MHSTHIGAAGLGAARGARRGAAKIVRTFSAAALFGVQLDDNVPV